MGEGPPRGNRHFVSEGALRKAWVRIHAAGFRVRGLGRFRTGRLMELLCLLVGAPQGVPLCICPMQLRSLCFTERPGPAQGLSGPGGLRCLLAIHRWTADGKAAVGVAGPSTPAWRSGLLCLTGTPEPFSAPRRTIFCTGPGLELCVVSPHQQHRSRLDASPCVVADARRNDSGMEGGGGDEECEKICLLSFK